jgi:L-amino acid N-acyltransferase YncA
MIRAYQESDIEPVRTLLNEVVARGDAFVYDAPFSADSARGWIASYAAAYVAEVEGRVAGCYVLRPNQPGRGSHVANAAYMVSPAARGRGLGRTLGEHSLQTAKELGFTALQFNAVVATNVGAVALWRSLGFAIIGTVPRAFRHADGCFVDLHMMHRTL